MEVDARALPEKAHAPYLHRSIHDVRTYHSSRGNVDGSIYLPCYLCTHGLDVRGSQVGNSEWIRGTRRNDIVDILSTGLCILS